jgi:uncharacterized protein (TIGR03437 family)
MCFALFCYHTPIPIEAVRKNAFMTLQKIALYLTVCAAVSATALRAQYLVTFQGPADISQDGTVSFFDPTTLALGPTLQVPGALQFLSLSDGSELYLITNNSGAAITVLHPKLKSLSGTAQGRRDIGNFANPLNCGALSPDDSRLVVGENAVHIFDTGSNVDLTPNGIGVGSGAAIVNVAVSYDSTTAYALATYNGSSYLASISISELGVTNSVDIAGTATGLALGPNGLLYVSGPNEIMEINPATLAPTPNGVTPVNATLGPLVFTPDGNYALGANQTFGTQPAIVLLNLNDHLIEGSVPFTGLAALESSPITGNPAYFDGLYVASPTTVYAFSSGGQSLFDLQVGTNGGLVLEIPVIANVTLSAIAAATLSNDMGLPGRNYPQSLFVVDSAADPLNVTGGEVLYRIDPASSLLTQQAVLASLPGAVAYYSPTFNPNNTPTTVLAYGNNQTLLPGGVALPMVVQVLDQNGLPISGMGVNFAIGSGTGTVVPVNTVTGANGFAQTIFTAGSTPADIGSISISANVGPAQQTFTVNVGTNQTATPAALSIVSGQGQIILGNPITGVLGNVAPLIVLATDSNGNPVSNALVTFMLTSGPGGLQAPDGSQQTVVVAPTDATGEAYIIFTPILVSSYRGFQQATVTASTVTGTDDDGNPITASQSFVITTMPLDVEYCANPPCNPAVNPLVAQVVQPAEGTVLTGLAGSTLPNPVLVQVYSIAGPAIPNVGVKVSTGSSTEVPNASCAGSAGGLALTDANGLATCNVVLDGVPGTKPLTISIPEAGIGNGTGLVFSGYTLTIQPGAAANIKILSGNNQVVLPGAVLASVPPPGEPSGAPFLIQVTDAFNNPVPGAPVTWTVESGSFVLAGASTVTAPNGEAIGPGRVTSPGGTTITVQVSVGSASATFTVLVEIPAATIQVVSGSDQSAVINTPFSAPLVVQLQTTSGSPASFAPVAFSSKGELTFSSTLVTSDVNGMASTMVTSSGPIAGAFAVSAITGSGKNPPTATFLLTTLPLGPQSPTILNSASYTPNIAPGGLVTFTGAGLTPTIQGVVTDPTQMGSYSVSFDGNPATILALINQNGIQQINAQVPFEEEPGTSDNVDIETPQGSASLSNITVAALAPAIFTNGTLSAFGQSYPLAQATRPDGSVVSASNPAQPGENITFFATGLGQTVPAASDGVPGVPGQIVGSALYAGVNNQGDAVISAIYEPNAIGVYVVTIQIPSATTPGPAQPLGLLMVDIAGNSYSSQPAYIPIQ